MFAKFILASLKCIRLGLFIRTYLVSCSDFENIVEHTFRLSYQNALLKCIPIMALYFI